MNALAHDQDATPPIAVSGAPDTAVVSELRRIAHDMGGELKPAAVVDAARDPQSPLHDKFEWDDSAAAEKYRLEQARHLIRAVVSYQPLTDGKLVPTRVFVSLTPDRERDGGGYRLVVDVLSDTQRRQQMLKDARAEMIRFRAKYHALAELAKVFAAMDAVG